MSAIEVEFIHTDNTSQKLICELNPLTGSWLYTFDNWGSAYKTDKRGVNSLIKSIEKKSLSILKKMIDDK